MNIHTITLGFLLTLLISLVAGQRNCSCYIYVGGYYSQQPFLLGNIENVTSCMNCTQEACQTTFVTVLDTLEQYYNYAYPFYIYPYCLAPTPSPSTTVQTQVSEQLQESVQVSSNLPNVKVNVTSAADIQVNENVQEQYYPSGYYASYPWDYYNYYSYYYSYYYPYGYYNYQPECCQGSNNDYQNISRQLDTMETQIQRIMYMLEALNQTSEIDGISTNLTILSNYVMMFEKMTNSSFNSTQVLLDNMDMSMKSNFTKLYGDLMSLGMNITKDSNYTKEELNQILTELSQLNESMSSYNSTIEMKMELMETNISRLNKEYKQVQSNLTYLNSQTATASTSNYPSNKAVSSSSTSPTAIAGVVLGSIAVAGIVVVVVLVVMRIIV